MKFNLICTSDTFQEGNPAQNLKLGEHLEYIAKPVKDCYRDKPAKVYSIEILRIEDLFDIMKKTGDDLVIRKEPKERFQQDVYDKTPLPNDYTIEIYDYWRE